MNEPLREATFRHEVPTPVTSEFDLCMIYVRQYTTPLAHVRTRALLIAVGQTIRENELSWQSKTCCEHVCDWLWCKLEGLLPMVEYYCGSYHLGNQTALLRHYIDNNANLLYGLE